MYKPWRPKLLDRFKRQPARGEGGTGNIYIVASGKGGVGKTWFSITLTALLAARGARTLLFDGDLGMANVDIQLGLMPKKDLVNVIEGSCQLTEAIVPFRLKDGTKFSILPGRSGNGVLGNMPVQRLMVLREGIKVLARAYNDVILDFGAGADNTVRILSGLPATALVVTTEEPTALTDAYALIKMLRAQKLSLPIQIVVNMADTESGGMRTYATLSKACAQFLGFTPSLAGVIRRDKYVRDSIRNQQPLIERFPQSTALGDVQSLINKLERTHMKTVA